MSVKSSQSKKAGFTKRIESEKSLLPATYQFNIGDKVRYLGGMNPEYKGKVATVTSRSNKGHRIDYSILFEDNVEKRYIVERVLELYEEWKVYGCEDN